jgi:hypothetical protein
MFGQNTKHKYLHQSVRQNSLTDESQLSLFVKYNAHLTPSIHLSFMTANLKKI